MTSIRDHLQKIRRSFSEARLKNGIMKATGDELRLSVESCERAAKIGSYALLAGLLVEVALAIFRVVFHPPYDSPARSFGRVTADVFVFLGVGAEVLFSRMGAGRQHELQRRSDEQLGVAQREAAEARERTALTELRLKELGLRVGPRNVDETKFLAELEGKTPPSSVQIQYDKDVPDGYSTGWQLQQLLKKAGWNSPDPQVIAPRSHFWGYVQHNIIETGVDGRVVGTGSGIVVVRRYGYTLGDALTSAINSTLGSLQVRWDAGVPEKELIVLIFGRS